MAIILTGVQIAPGRSAFSPTGMVCSVSWTGVLRRGPPRLEKDPAAGLGV
jgi:hypothetical protein